MHCPYPDCLKSSNDCKGNLSRYVNMVDGMKGKYEARHAGYVPRKSDSGASFGDRGVTTMPWQIDAESLIVCLNAIREQFPAYVSSESECIAGDKAIFQVIEIVEDVMAGEFPRYGCAIDAAQIGDCDGCKWKQKRHQKCSCCRRNRHLKDNFEED